MIPSEQLNKIASNLYERITSAKVYMGDSVIEGTIKKKIIENNIIKVFVSLSIKDGEVTKIEIIDTDGDILQVQDMNVIKSNKYKFLAVVEIRVENEVIRDGRY